MSDNNNNPQTNPEPNAEDNTKNTIQEEKGQKTTQEVVKTPDSTPEPKAEIKQAPKKPAKDDNLLYFKKQAEGYKGTAEEYKTRLDDLEAKFELTKKTAEVKEVLYNSEINPELTDLVMDKLLKSDDPQAELKTLLESKPSLKKAESSKKPMFPSSSSGGGNPKSVSEMNTDEYLAYRKTLKR